MPELDIQHFAEEHIEPASKLLADRHARHREAEPLLPETLDFRAEIEALWNAEQPSGTVALRNGKVVGYLLGIQRPEEWWGDNVWVELAGHAVAEPEIVRDLYGFAADKWVEAGRTRHYAVVPATDHPLLDAWFRLSFGAQHAAGIQELPAEVDGSEPPGIKVRRAGPDDLETAIRLDGVLPQHQGGAPVFSPVRVSTDEEIRDEYLEDLRDPQVAMFIADLDGDPVALLAMVDVAKSSMHSSLGRPERAALLAYAATIPEARGFGAGVALTNAGLAWAREQGYPVVVTDWRETNLLSSRFWPARGFRRSFQRLYRSIP
jgi:GNAT superfamily N-acetyltransferase